MKNLFICYPKCTTCQKARKWLDSAGISYNERDISRNNPTEQELKDWIKRSGLTIKKFFNTSGLKYRELKLKDKLPQMNDQEQIKILASDGMLVKRPILITEKSVLVGFSQDKWEKLQ